MLPFHALQKWLKEMESVSLVLGDAVCKGEIKSLFDVSGSATTQLDHLLPAFQPGADNIPRVSSGTGKTRTAYT